MNLRYDGILLADRSSQHGRIALMDRFERVVVVPRFRDLWAGLTELTYGTHAENDDDVRLRPHDLRLQKLKTLGMIAAVAKDAADPLADALSHQRICEKALATVHPIRQIVEHPNHALPRAAVQLVYAVRF